MAEERELRSLHFIARILCSVLTEESDEKSLKFIKILNAFFINYFSICKKEWKLYMHCSEDNYDNENNIIYTSLTNYFQILKLDNKKD